MKIGAAYIRVSTEDQLEFSPESQIKKIKEYAQNNNIILPDKFVFTDKGISGKHAEKRPGFMRMIQIAKTKPKPFDVILVWKFSRFARNRQDSIIYKSMLRKNYNIDIVSITEQLSKDPTAILVEALLEAMDEYYSINLAQEVKRGMNEKFSRGGIVSSPPLGYKMGKNCFEIDKHTAPIIEMIFNDFINDVPIRQIAIKLNDLGMRTKRGNLFENRTIEYILTNPVYIGKLRRNLTGLDKNDRFHQGKNVSVIDGKHPSIIDSKTFNKVQKKISYLRKSQKTTNILPVDFMLKGLVYCSNCGGKLTQAVKGKSLQCYKYAKGQCNKSHSISLSKINKAVLTKLRSDLENQKEFVINIKVTSKYKEKNCLSSLLDKERKKLEKITTAYENGVDTIDEYKIKKRQILDRVEELEKQSLLSIKNNRRHTFSLNFYDMILKLESDYLSENEKNIILKSFISKIIFDREKNSLQICYYF